MFSGLSSGQLAPAVLVRFATALVILGLIAGCVVKRVVWRPDDPRLVRGVRPEIPETSDPAERQRQLEARRDHAGAVLQEKIGEPFPNLSLINPSGEVVRLSSFRGRRLAVLAAINSFVVTRKWMKEIASREWEAPPGFDELVILISNGGGRSWNRQVRKCPNAYLVGWPLEGFLAEWRIYPTMYAVSAEGLFEGYWSYEHQSVVGGDQSNNSLNLPVRSATARR